jgi:hypothetical protein
VGNVEMLRWTAKVSNEACWIGQHTLKSGFDYIERMDREC